MNEPLPITAGKFLARFRDTEEASRCPTCGARLLFTGVPAHATGPPPTLH